MSIIMERNSLVPTTLPSEREYVAGVLEPVLPRLSRRQFLARSTSVLGMAVAGSCISETTHIEITRHTVPIRNLSEPLRVVQLTDLHRSWCVSEGYIASCVDIANRLKPDIIALTGDFISHTTEYVPSCFNHIVRLKPRIGMYAVLGNHDYAADNWNAAPVIANSLAGAGVELLIDQNTRLSNGLWIVGIDDLTTQAPVVDNGFAGVKPGEPALVMTHNPQMWDGFNDRECVALTGHTHGGQIDVPFLTEFVHPDRTFYLKGWFRKPGKPSRLYVSRGVGVVDIPFRFRSRPEISVFELTPA